MELDKIPINDISNNPVLEGRWLHAMLSLLTISSHILL